MDSQRLVRDSASNLTLRGFSTAVALLSILVATSDHVEAGVGVRGDCPPTYLPEPTPVPRPATIIDPSPNFGDRTNVVGSVIDSVVMHTTEVSLQETLNIFRTRASSVSSHFVIAENGDIYEMVDTTRRAWHATYYNDRSIGIEMVGFADDPNTWNEDNLNALADLLAWLVTAYPTIPIGHPGGDAYDFGSNYNLPGLVAHSQVQPWNKSDPGIYFPWNDVINDVNAKIAAIPEPSSLALVFVSASLGLIRRRR